MLFSLKAPCNGVSRDQEMSPLHLWPNPGLQELYPSLGRAAVLHGCHSPIASVLVPLISWEMPKLTA